MLFYYWFGVSLPGLRKKILCTRWLLWSFVSQFLSVKLICSGSNINHLRWKKLIFTPPFSCTVVVLASLGSQNVYRYYKMFKTWYIEVLAWVSGTRKFCCGYVVIRLVLGTLVRKCLLHSHLSHAAWHSRRTDTTN